ncbi:Dual specificity protein phosphatase CDC14A [Hypsibius exemplaris]|uniref:protein-tyrosine-phosphatase n=1 Tax=Hypsibius exemplaris TaxID=2072580 RepID=A0A1W0WVZ4_HYPEX|nr:Dual specificity protein phosphatase CDC14A [Hypsibius exemplaris]
MIPPLSHWRVALPLAINSPRLHWRSTLAAMTSTSDSGLSNGDTTDGSMSPTSSDDGILKTAVTIIPDRLYFVRSDTVPDARDDLFSFNTDSELVYDSFFDDFGPLNIAKVYRYCEKVQKLLLLNEEARKRKVVHYTSLTEDRKFVNAAWLIGAYAIIKLKKTPEEVLPQLEAAARRNIISFRDASCGPATYKLPLKDCLIALHRSIELRFFDYDSFDLEEYEYYERVENGDFNWITPKFLAFCGPHQRTKLDGYPVHAPEEYFKYFKEHNISTIVRLNSPQYSAERFVTAGFDHKDLIFPDGTSPADHILKEFLRIAETAKGGLAIHCKAGLGRTGTLIAAYLMKHNQFSASEAIAWCRIVRPGSVIGQQQHYLESIKDKLWMDGTVANRANPAAYSSPLSTEFPGFSINGGCHLTRGETSGDHVKELVEISSSSVSTEVVDESGRTTVHEITVVETTISAVCTDPDNVPLDPEGDPSTDDAKIDDDDETTQGDVLNNIKVLRDKARNDRCHTRSMARSGPPVEDAQPPSPPMNDKLQKPKKLKTR